MLTLQQIYDAGREAYIAGFRERHCPMVHSVGRREWLRGMTQEHNDEQDVLTVMKRGVAK